MFKEGEEEAEYRELFKTYDKNGDKKLTVKELAATMSEVNKLDKKECEKLFLDLGKSKKDHIEEDEFVDMLKSFIQGDFFDGAGNKGADGKPLSQENAVSTGLRQVRSGG